MTEFITRKTDMKIKLNDNFGKLSKNYLFSEIAKRVNTFKEEHPEVKVIKMGIGDVTLPLPSLVVKAMKDASDEMGKKETFRGYPPEYGYAFLRERISAHYSSFGVNIPAEDIFVDINPQLFEWVIENLCKNAVDAMEGEGRITLRVREENSRTAIEVEDTGKGIRKKDIRNVFTPGFTTKKRGWGLGLSLAKRIVEEYHKGKIFVKSSEIGKGTTFRIELRCHSMA